MEELAQILQLADVIVPLVEKVVDNAQGSDLHRKVAKIQTEYLQCFLDAGYTKEEAIRIYASGIPKLR